LTSAYNIDHAKLEQELSRVKLERERLGTGQSISGSSTGDKIGRTSTSGTEVSEEEDDVADEATSPDDLEAVAPQRRLQPPRGGFNLCV
jgi:hypothetical protein